MEKNQQRNAEVRGMMRFGRNGLEIKYGLLDEKARKKGWMPL